MAITQQFARISLEELNRCKHDKQALNAIITFRHPKSSYLDLNWAGTGLEILFEKSNQNVESQEMLNLALNSDSVVNPEWEIEPLNNNRVYSPITYLTPEQVHTIAEQLAKIDLNSVLSCFPESIQEANALVKLEFAVHPRTV